ncbi:PLC-like phosphodiesterase [Elsinoe ampelina]|uniref:PLC-like phosphodiesterase n=1 Tax=Elsinoe ampelina TaxID=302913 RepID=A0A6A6G1M8_9PEZI|nr:PLC-like phosphodiesterase [Elsinoe ampelina]
MQRPWCISQPNNFMDQLETGIRYFDLRVETFMPWFKGERNYKFVHGLVGPSTDELFHQLSEFLARPENDKEVVILDFQQFFGFGDVMHEHFVGILRRTFVEKLASSDLGVDVTLDELWKGASRIVVFYADVTAVKENDFLWPRDQLESNWPNAQDSSGVVSYLEGQLPYEEQKFFVLQGVITPSMSTFKNSMIPLSIDPSSLLDLGKHVNPLWETKLKEWKHKGVNVVMVDHANYSPSFVETVVALNS